MKIWRFYKKPKKHSDKRDYNLYAITNNKKLAEDFINTRNMKVFICKKSEEDKEDWLEYANENRGQVLDYYKLNTFTVDEDNQCTTKKVKIPITFFEYQNCDSDQCENVILDSSFWSEMPPYPIFNSKVIDALRNLEFISTQRFVHGYMGMEESDLEPLLRYIDDNSDSYSLKEDDNMVYDDGDFASPEVEVDEVSLFIKIFKDTLV